MSYAVATAVTGLEDPIDPLDALGVLAEFYKAFNSRDLGLMELNWVSTDEASMDNPLGGIRRGWGAIREVYERIFFSEAKVCMEFHDYTVHRFGEMFFAVGRERGMLQRGDLSLDLDFGTSRLFRFTGGRWRQVHHHGSIEDPGLLARYQAALR